MEAPGLVGLQADGFGKGLGTWLMSSASPSTAHFGKDTRLRHRNSRIYSLAANVGGPNNHTCRGIGMADSEDQLLRVGLVCPPLVGQERC